MVTKVTSHHWQKSPSNFRFTCNLHPN